MKCTCCKINKKLNDFHKNQKRCKVCSKLANKKYYSLNYKKINKKSYLWFKNNKRRHNLNGKNWRKRNPEKVRESLLKHAYGISLVEFNKMLKQQKNVCAICKLPERSIHNKTKKIRSLAVDHCHKTGKIRGLLCYTCNNGIGMLKFDNGIKLFNNAIKYYKDTK